MRCGWINTDLREVSLSEPCELGVICEYHVGSTWGFRESDMPGATRTELMKYSDSKYIMWHC